MLVKPIYVVTCYIVHLCCMSYNNCWMLNHTLFITKEVYRYVTVHNPDFKEIFVVISFIHVYIPECKSSNLIRNHCTNFYFNVLYMYTLKIITGNVCRCNFVNVLPIKCYLPGSLVYCDKSNSQNGFFKLLITKTVVSRHSTITKCECITRMGLTTF